MSFAANDQVLCAVRKCLYFIVIVLLGPEHVARAKLNLKDLMAKKLFPHSLAVLYRDQRTVDTTLKICDGASIAESTTKKK